MHLSITSKNRHGAISCFPVPTTWKALRSAAHLWVTSITAYQSAVRPAVHLMLEVQPERQK